MVATNKWNQSSLRFKLQTVVYPMIKDKLEPNVLPRYYQFLPASDTFTQESNRNLK